MFEDVSVRDYLYVNEFDGVVWFNREQLETALSWMIVTSAAATLTDEELTPSQQAAIVRSRRDCVRTILETAHEAGYQVDALLALLARPA